MMNKPGKRKFAGKGILPFVNTALLILIVIAQALILVGIYRPDFNSAVKPLSPGNPSARKTEELHLEIQELKSGAEQISAELDRFFDCIINNPEELFNGVYRMPAGQDNIYRMHEDMSRIFNRALVNFRRLRPPLGIDEAWNNLAVSPAMDIRDIGPKYLVSLTLQGVERSDINVSTENEVLLISVNRGADNAAQNGKDNIERRIRFPAPIEADAMKINFDDGMLRITVPKKRKPGTHHFLLKKNDSELYYAGPIDLLRNITHGKAELDA